MITQKFNNFRDTTELIIVSMIMKLQKIFIIL